MSTRREDSGSYLVLQITNLDDKDYPFSFTILPMEINCDERFTEKVQVEGVLSKVGNQYSVAGSVTGVFQGECDRCLTDVRERLEKPFQRYYQVSERIRPDSAEDEDEEFRTIGLGTHAIVLDDEVRQLLLLGLPLKLLCKEGCLGICSECGKNRNEETCECERESLDPRWGKLAELMRQKERDR